MNDFRATLSYNGEAPDRFLVGRAVIDYDDLDRLVFSDRLERLFDESAVVVAGDDDRDARRFRHAETRSRSEWEADSSFGGSRTRRRPISCTSAVGCLSSPLILAEKCSSVRRANARPNKKSVLESAAAPIA
jgi:hypothetical protein